MSDRLTTGQWMATDAPLISVNGLYAAYLQDDANLVLCYTANGAADLSRPYWSVFANAAAQVGGPRTGPHYCAVMQADGNFVLYNGPNPGNQGPPYWATGTNRAQDQFTAVIQNDANFVVYDGTGQPIWASNTERQPEPVSTASPTPPSANPGSVQPPTDSSNTSTALAQEQAKAAQQGYYDPGCVVTYQGAQYTVMGVSIGYTNNVPHVNGEDLQPVGGGPIVNLVPYSALTLVAPPPPTTPPPSPSGQPAPPPPVPAPPPPPPTQDRADPGHVFGIDQNSIQSPYGQFWLEAPGIFVLQDAAGNHKWESPYNGAPANGGCSGEMQTDGNLVAYAYYVYGGGAGTAKNPTWASGTQGNPGAYLLIDWQTYTAKVMSPDGTTVLWHS